MLRPTACAALSALILAGACNTPAPAKSAAVATAPTSSTDRAPRGDVDMARLWDRLPDRDRPALEKALEMAGDNANELRIALDRVEPEMRPGMAFLVATMPERDLRSLSAEFLLANVHLAYEAWRGAPWGSDISEQMFFQYILPYANVNERRDDWRGDFVKRFQAEAWKQGDRMSAVRWINDHLNDAVNVHYHASKRKKPDQSPYESMELGFASCTGLSILLVDACRACGIPARCVGCPAWTVVQGNHTWVEVFANDAPDGKSTRDRWFNVGDTGSDPRGENWVNERCRTETNPDDWAHAVWASTWRRTGKHFPLPWEWEIDYVPALNVTRFYTAPIDVPFVLAKPGPATVDAIWNGELVDRYRLADANTTVSLRLARGEHFDVVVRYADGTREDKTIAP